MPISLIPRATATQSLDAEPGSLVMVLDNEVMRFGLVAAPAEAGRPKSVICIVPQDESAFTLRRLDEQPCISFGSHFKIECDDGLDAYVLASNWTKDLVGGVLIDGNGAVGLVLPPAEGRFRYLTFAGWTVGFQRPDARAMVLRWSISVGDGTDRRVLAGVIEAKRP